MISDDPNARLIARLEEMAANLVELDEQLADPAIASNPARMREIGIKRAALAPLCDKFNEYLRLRDEADHLKELIQSPDDEDAELIELARSEFPEVSKNADDLLESIKADLVTAEDRSIGSVILELRAGVGGDEAGLWVGDLLEMYRRYAANRGWKVEELSVSAGEVGGIRAAIFNITGEGVWAELGYEGGTHQVKRVPATEAQGRIHTSTATVAVLPEPEEVDVDLNEDEVEVHVTTAQGPGGQNVNKVATAVHLIHRPTGIEVRMQESKSQHQNREKAWKLLRARLYEKKREEADRERAEQRVSMIGSGSRAEKIRTYRYKDNIAVDHRLKDSFNLTELLAGRMEPLVNALIEYDTAQRLAAL